MYKSKSISTFAFKLQNMKIQSLYFYSLLCILALLWSCKNDPKTPSKNDILNPAQEESGSYSYSRDSAQIAEKLKRSGQEVSPEKIDAIINEAKNIEQNQLPKACDLLKAKLVADEFDVREANIIISDGKRRSEGTQHSSSCFWRWTGGGILVQVNRNPLPDEIPNWTDKYIDAKKTQGERNIENGETKKYQFKEFKGPGTENLYNHQLGRYYCEYDERFIVSLIFNYNMEEKQQLKAAQKFLESIFSNLD